MGRLVQGHVAATRPGAARLQRALRAPGRALSRAQRAGHTCALIPLIALQVGEGAGLEAQQAPAKPPPDGYQLYVGAAIVAPFSVHTTSPGLSPAEARTRTGYEIGAGLGYRAHSIRIGSKVIYGRLGADRIRFDEGGGRLDGYYDLSGATFDLLFDLPTGGQVRPYLGAGLGGVRFRAREVTLAGFPPTIGVNTLLSQQVSAGFSYPAARWRLVFGYRFLRLGAQDYETGGVPLRGEPIWTHAVQLGTAFPFSSNAAN